MSIYSGKTLLGVLRLCNVFTDERPDDNALPSNPLCPSWLILSAINLPDKKSAQRCP